MTYIFSLYLINGYKFKNIIFGIEKKNFLWNLKSCEMKVFYKLNAYTKRRK